ncbi:protein kinase domain-containing protein [Rhodococcus opacus]|uniref:protein kinase domain-containing protein n=1 Tax=Rhodococcus opacus TaxID=37919 RepID=UPI000EAA5EE7|nr:protein kinase [Rhodococcus opacus]QZS52689.1 protein kinase [Rhodococcus opacus]RKM65312.1 protein kinase [Rhodococcus opacus]
MTDIDPNATQRDASGSVAADLSAAGFEDAREIGRGGFGVVYRCNQAALDRTVAVKVLTADLDEQNQDRFLREQRAAGRLTGHPNVVNVLHVGVTDNGRPYIVMPYHAQDSLDARIRNRGPLPLDEALRLGVKMAGALETAHRLGILHRDVKPGNILLTDYGEPALTDFGIARIAGGFETTAGVVTGSPAFTAPEVVTGEPPSAAADVYGLGATLFAVMTGHAAFERRSGEQVVAQFLRIAAEPGPNPRKHGVPEDVSAIIECAMAGAPERRPSATELGQQLRASQRLHGFPLDEMALHTEPGDMPREEKVAPTSPLISHAHEFFREVTSFVGRRKEVAAVKACLSDSRIVTLTGFGGVGKTRLACRVAAEVRRTYTGGVWFVDLAAISNPDLVVSAITEALDIRDGTNADGTHYLFEFLADKHALIVLDNCEHLIDSCGSVAAEIVRWTDRVQILATSREPLGVFGESVFEVPPMSVLNEENLADGRDMRFHSEAIDLFEQRAASVVPGYTLDDESRLGVARLCQRLDGIPLAIELAAVRIRSLPLDRVLSREGALFDLLTRGNRGGPMRHQTLRGAIDWSFNLCSPEEQALWTRMSVFAGGFDFDAVESVCTDPEIVPDVFEIISSLVEKSVISTVQSGSTVRYKLLESIKDYAAEKLAEQGDEDTWRRNHRDYFLRLAERSESQSLGSGQLVWNRRLRHERANLRAALEYCLSNPGEIRTGLRMAGALWFFWNASGLLRDGRYWLTRALETDQEPSSERAKALWVIGWYVMLQGDNATAKQYLLESSAVAESIGDRTAQAFALQFRGTVEELDGHLDVALELLTTAMKHHAESGEVNSLTLLGGAQLAFVHCLSGNLEQSLASADETIALGKSLRECFATSWALWSRGLALWTQREFAQASDSLKEAIELKQSLSDWLGVSVCVEILAWTAIEEGNPVRAARLLGIGRTLCGEMGSSPLFGSDELVRTRTRYEKRARQLLGDSAFEKESRAGERFDHLASIEFALHKRTSAPAVPATPTPSAKVKLTPREKEVGRLVAEGLTNKEIAERLVISPRTAEGHVDRILTKTGQRSRAQLASWITREETIDSRKP